MNELLNCPFCGSDNVMPEVDVTSFWRIYIVCKNCFTQGPSFIFIYPNKKEEFLQMAIDGWNKRVQNE